MERHRIQQKCVDVWVECVKWNIQRDEKMPDHPASVTKVSLSIENNDDDESLRECVEGLHISKLLELRMKNFSGQFQKYILPFVTDPSSTSVELKKSSSSQTLVVSKSVREAKGGSKGAKHKSGGGTKEKNDSIPDHELYKAVFENLVTILDHLHTILLHADYGLKSRPKSSLENLSSAEKEENEEELSPTKETLMGLLGKEVGASLLEFIQRDVIAKAIPTTAKDLDGFEKVITATLELQGQCPSLKTCIYS